MTLAELDRAGLLVLRTRGHHPVVERVVGGYSRLGEHGALWLALGLGGVRMSEGAERGRWRRGARLVLVAYGLNYAAKLLLRRPRPELPGLPPLTGVISGLSLPSAHATTAFAAARAYTGLLPAGALYGLAITLALSRPYLGVHYPGDVLAGAVLGTVLAEIWP